MRNDIVYRRREQNPSSACSQLLDRGQIIVLGMLGTCVWKKGKKYSTFGNCCTVLHRCKKPNNFLRTL